MTEPGTESLTQGLVRGDETAYREFYRQYAPRLFRYLLVLIRGNEAAAREALQETLRRVVRHIRVFHDPEVFWSWLTVVARSALFDERRRERRYRGFLDRWRGHSEIQADLGAAGPASGGEDRLEALLVKHLGLLRPEERELMERKYFQRDSVRDIATQLAVTEKTIESRLSRLRSKLKTAILAELNHEPTL